MSGPLSCRCDQTQAMATRQAAHSNTAAAPSFASLPEDVVVQVLSLIEPSER